MYMAFRTCNYSHMIGWESMDRQLTPGPNGPACGSDDASPGLSSRALVELSCPDCDRLSRSASRLNCHSEQFYKVSVYGR